MGYLYDEFEKRKQQAHIVDFSGFSDLVFEIYREMYKACTIAMKLGYVSSIKVATAQAAKQTESILSEKVQSRDVSKQSVQVEIEPKPTTAKAVKLTCNACGRWGHEMGKCNLKEHSDANRSSAKLAELVKKKEWKAR